MSGEANPPPRSEPDSPRTTFIFLFVLASAFVLTGIILGIDQFFSVSVREEIETKILRPESAQLRQLRVDEEAKLTRYQWIDPKAGILRIPVGRARELILAEWGERASGFAAAAGDQDSKPTPGSNVSKPAPPGKAAKPPSERGESKEPSPPSK